MKADPRATLAFGNFFCGGFFYCFKQSNLSDTSKKMGTTDWKTAFGRLAQEQCGKVTSKKMGTTDWKTAFGRPAQEECG